MTTTMIEAAPSDATPRQLADAIGYLSCALRGAMQGFPDGDAEVAVPVRWAMDKLEGLLAGGRV